MIEEYYESILQNDKLSAKEKLQAIDSTFDEILKESNSYYKSTKEAILKNYAECPFCEDYYEKSFFRYDVGTEIIKECTNPMDGYLDRYEYEDREVCFKYATCPKGHKFKIMRIR